MFHKGSFPASHLVQLIHMPYYYLQYKKLFLSIVHAMILYFCGVAVTIYREGGLKVLFELLLKCSGGFCNIFFNTL